MNKSLYERIKTEVSKGVPLEQIRQGLSESGWSDSDINGALGSPGSSTESTRAGKIARMTKTGGKIWATRQLIGAIPLAVILGLFAFVFLYLAHLIWWGMACAVLAAGFLAAGIIRLKRISTVDIGPPSSKAEKAINIKIDRSEKVIGHIAGIMRSGWASRSYEFYGTGQVKTSENAMVITDRRILFITVPLPGADKIVAGTSIPSLQWLIAKKDIEDKLEEMISSMSLEDIFQTNPRNFSINLNEIKKVQIGRHSQALKFVTQDNKKYSYSIRDKEDFIRAKEIFTSYS
jgi:hypothetical protein